MGQSPRGSDEEVNHYLWGWIGGCITVGIISMVNNFFLNIAVVSICAIAFGLLDSRFGK